MAHRLAGRGGVDLEALSPRDANAQRVPKATTDVKTKTAAQLKAAKEKEHPPPPPAHVIEPPSSDRPDGAVYQVGKLLGKGGFAVCYHGQLQNTKHKYALKIVKSQMPAKMEQKFQTELQIHSKMRQKNIVQFLRAFAFENSTYLVLELCPNGSLMDMVKRRKGLTEPEVRYYSVQIAGAIKYMHSKGIIHRDLKMGNIFLDQNMDAKIGDFGLAALLVTGRDMHTIRRTTLCGTPNYIAPEILEKGKKGHDHMVDIWSLGIIMFAMLTSKPPFQSSTTDEIYRRARERDYEWPDMEASQKYISREAKDLVASMLEDADRRPDPDSIVQHPFFVSGYMPVPSDISPKLKDGPPENPEFFASRMTPSMQSQAIKNLRDLCRDCAVGPWTPVQVIHTQIWKEVAAEEKAGLTPMIPLAENIVYRPFEEWLQEQRLQSRQSRVLAPAPSYPSIGSDDTMNLTQKAPSGLLRAPPQSFAAQQRAQYRPTTSQPPAALRQTNESAALSSQPTRTRLRKEMQPSETRTVESRPQVYEPSQKNPVGTIRTQLPSSRTANILPGASSNSKPNQDSDPAKSSSKPRMTSLFSPSERPYEVIGTRPDIILDRLRRLQAELERALNSRTMAIISPKDTEPPRPNVVVKWVDYTNKFGLGYILNEGSVGCVLREIPVTESSKTALLPPACMLVHDAERHIQRQQDPTYAERHQLFPMLEEIQFYENNGETGLSCLTVPPEKFRVPVKEDGTAGKLNPGRDIYEHRKRERIILWKKFANYMIANGRDELIPGEQTSPRVPTARDPDSQPSDVVTFYQRFGDVGCWVFGDGHLQFNFPDHTKIVLDATGNWCHFWHLPQEAAENLAKTGSLGATALDERALLSYPLQTLLNFQSKPTVVRGTRTASSRRRPEIDPMKQGIPAANDFRHKIEFIKNVVKEWVHNGGMGNSDMSRETRLRWTGCRETVLSSAPQKHVWVTVGARWGDKRLSAYVDPRRPAELGADIEETKGKRSVS